jgi:uncharacterized membrane protein YccC
VNPYQELGVPPDADGDAINAAYRRAAKDAHPDAGGDPEKFAQLGRAVAVLRDPVKRDRFDRTGQIDDGPDNETSAIVEILLAQFMQAVEQCPDLDLHDVVDVTRRSLIVQLDQVQASRETAIKAQRRNAKAIQHLKFKGKGSDFVGTTLANQAAQIGELIAAHDRQFTMIGKAIALLKDYTWAVDYPPPRRFSFNSSNSPPRAATSLG